jgi:putative endonuclease
VESCTRGRRAPDRDGTARAAVYVLLCGDGSLYTGATLDVPRRLEQHRQSKAAKYTRGRQPVRLLAWWHTETFSIAKSHEARFKRLRRAHKLEALAGREIYGCRVYRSDA